MMMMSLLRRCHSVRGIAAKLPHHYQHIQDAEYNFSVSAKLVIIIYDFKAELYGIFYGTEDRQPQYAVRAMKALLRNNKRELLATYLQTI